VVPVARRLYWPWAALDHVSTCSARTRTVAVAGWWTSMCVDDTYSGWYELLAGWSEGEVTRQALLMLSAREGEDILELGPGTGRALVLVAQAVGPPGRVFGVDPSVGMLRRSRARLMQAAQAGRVALVCGHAARLPLHASIADAALAILALERLDRPAMVEALAECRRVLRPGGRLVVAALAEGKARHPTVRLYRLARERYPRWLSGRPIRLRPLLTGAGLDIVDVVATSIWGLPVEIVLARSPVPR